MTDDTETITDLGLSATSIQFDVYDPVALSYKYTNQSAVTSGMLIQCLVDTNSGGLWAVQLYDLLVHFVIGSETPRLGPFPFFVIAPG